MVSASRAQPQLAQGVPPYGAAGQVLAKTADTPYADGWADLPPYGSALNAATVQYSMMDVRQFLGFASSGSTITITTGSVSYVPFWSEQSVQVVNCGLWISSYTAGNAMNFGGAQCLPNGMPGPIIGSGNYLTAGFAANGWVTTAYVGTFTLPAGWSYLWLGNSGSTGSIVVNCLAATGTVQYPYFIPQLHLGNGTGPTATPSTSCAIGWKASGVGGIAPSTTPSVLSQITPPLIFFQANKV